VSGWADQLGKMGGVFVRMDVHVKPAQPSGPPCPLRGRPTAVSWSGTRGAPAQRTLCPTGSCRGAAGGGRGGGHPRRVGQAGGRVGRGAAAGSHGARGTGRAGGRVRTEGGRWDGQWGEGEGAGLLAGPWVPAPNAARLPAYLDPGCTTASGGQVPARAGQVPARALPRFLQQHGSMGVWGASCSHTDQSRLSRCAGCRGRSV
jgi:hypothetical protein